MAKTMKSCPFCGSKVLWQSPMKGGCLKQSIECGRCDASGPKAYTCELAIAAWNRRAKGKGGVR